MSGPAFAVLGLPRSGTSWAAAWLSDGGAVCLHDPIQDHAPGDIAGLDMGRQFGVSCSGLWLFPGVAERIAKRVPVVALIRSPGESNASLARLGLAELPAWMHRRFGRVPGMRVHWRDLWKEDSARMIWALLRPGVPFDRERWRMLCDLRVTPAVERMRIHPEASRQIAALAMDQASKH